MGEFLDSDKITDTPACCCYCMRMPGTEGSVGRGMSAVNTIVFLCTLFLLLADALTGTAHSINRNRPVLLGFPRRNPQTLCQSLAPMQLSSPPALHFSLCSVQPPLASKEADELEQNGLLPLQQLHFLKYCRKCTAQN